MTMTLTATPRRSLVRIAARRLRPASAVRRFTSSRSAVLGSAVMTILIILAIAAPLIAPDNPLAQSAAPLQHPSLQHLFGTDEVGRDLLSRIIYGTRDALWVAVGSAVLAALVGVPIGIMSGYLGHGTDYVLMRLMDVLLAMPTILLALVIVTILSPSDLNMLLAIAVGSVPTFARLTRSSTLAVSQQEYVVAARSMGAGRFDIMTRTVLPNIMGPIIVQLVVTASLAVTLSASLSFLGLGPPPPAPTWGGMLQTSLTFLYQNPWYGVFPGVFLAVTIASLDGIGSGLQAVFGLDSDRAEQPGSEAVL
jgi:peptide/nickel transport system permease protein